MFNNLIDKPQEPSPLLRIAVSSDSRGSSLLVPFPRQPRESTVLASLFRENLGSLVCSAKRRLFKQINDETSNPSLRLRCRMIVLGERRVSKDSFCNFTPQPRSIDSPDSINVVVSIIPNYPNRFDYLDPFSRLSKVFNHWKLYASHKKRGKEGSRTAFKLYRRNLQRKYLRLLKSWKTRNQAERTAREERARIFHESRIKKRLFHAWKLRWQEKRPIRETLKKLESIFDGGRRRDTWKTWRLFVHLEKCGRRRNFLAENCLKRQTLKNCLSVLRRYVHCKREKRQRLVALRERASFLRDELELNYLREWRLALYARIREKRNLQITLEFYERSLRGRFFRLWLKFCVDHRSVNCYKTRLREVGLKLLLEPILSSWKSKVEKILELRKKEDFAVGFSNRKLLTKGYSAWRGYHSKKQGKRLEIRDAEELFKKFCLREGLRRILRCYLTRTELENERRLTQAFQRLEILRIYLDRWKLASYIKPSLN